MPLKRAPPQRLKPRSAWGICGVAEATPFQNVSPLTTTEKGQCRNQHWPCLGLRVLSATHGRPHFSFFAGGGALCLCGLGSAAGLGAGAGLAEAVWVGSAWLGAAWLAGFGALSCGVLVLGAAVWVAFGALSLGALSFGADVCVAFGALSCGVLAFGAAV